MRLKIHHRTVYEYPRSVVNSVNEARLCPLTDERQSCLSFRLVTSPRSESHSYTDYFGNIVHYFDIQQPHLRLEVAADADVVTEDIDAAARLYSDLSPYEPLTPDQQDQWIDYLSETPLTKVGPLVAELTYAIGEAHLTVSDCVRAAADRVHDALKYEAGVTSVRTAAEDALEFGAGVCQDFTHVFLAVSRRLGIPARYVSGYLCLTAGRDERQASHAWAEVLLPEQGWVGLDVANGRLVNARYVRVAVGRDYSDVPPIRGAYSGPPGTEPVVAVHVYDDQQQ
jgi:transglutaminase-like putative cysteine protease